MSNTKNDKSQDRLTSTHININDDRIEVKEQTATFDQVFNSIRKIDPDFPEEYCRKSFEFSYALENGEIKAEDLEPGGRFSREVMEPVLQAMDELQQKDFKRQWNDEFATKKIVLGMIEKNDPTLIKEIKIPFSEVAERLRETNPDLTDEQVDLALGFILAGQKGWLQPELFEKGARFDKEILDPALKEFFKAMGKEERYDKIKEAFDL